MHVYKWTINCTRTRISPRRKLGQTGNPKPLMTAAQRAIANKIRAKLSLRDKSASFAIKPLFRTAGGTAFLPHDEFLKIMG